ncbi:MAG: replication initiation protein [Campylobacter sp.]|nr:replication initiation protein [Campylobacter sp.]MBR2849168.1 replication initiation protein [Mycoplasmataceae bacterium]MBR6612233.1 replication initiation protein [Campylobacter sp.]
MKNIVRYHNDFNKIKLPNFSSQEQNMLMGIICKVKEHSTNKNIKFTPNELLEFSTGNLTNKALGDMLFVLRDKFFKADFTILIKDEERHLVGRKTINLFEEFILWYYGEDANYDNLLEVELKLNPQFRYLIEELTANFTRFELEEFMSLSGKYTKTLYRLLKQFRNTGEVTIYKNNFQDFCEFMGIPESYPMGVIDQKILNPAIKELSAEANLFTNEKKTIFKNLTYKKIKDPKGRGRGGKVIGIEFYFTPEPKRNEFKEMIQNLARTEEEMEKNSGKEPKIHIITGEEVTELDRYRDCHFHINNKEFGGYDTCKIKDLKYINENGNKKIYALMLNQENGKNFEMYFDSIAHMKNALKLD